MKAQTLSIAIGFGALTAFGIAMTVKTVLQGGTIEHLQERVKTTSDEKDQAVKRLAAVTKENDQLKRSVKELSKVYKTSLKRTKPLKKIKPSSSPRQTIDRQPKIASASQPIKRHKGVTHINRAYKDRLLGQNLNATLKSARVVPQVKNGKIQGFRFVGSLRKYS